MIRGPVNDRGPVIDKGAQFMDRDQRSLGLGGGAALGLFLALGLIVSAFIVADTARDVVPVRDKIQVKGYSEKRVTSDLGKWTGQFSSRTPVLKGAYAGLQESRKKVDAFLNSQGFSGDAVDFAPVQTIVHFRYDPQGGMTNDIQAYELSQRVTVTSRDVVKLNLLSRQVTDLISDGVVFMSFPPQYYYTGLESLKLELLAEATANAKERATALATAGGASVGALRSARQGVFQITPAISTEVSDYGVYDTSSIDKAVKAVVTVEFAIE